VDCGWIAIGSCLSVVTGTWANKDDLGAEATRRKLDILPTPSQSAALASLTFEGAVGDEPARHAGGASDPDSSRVDLAAASRVKRAVASHRVERRRAIRSGIESRGYGELAFRAPTNSLSRRA
jgi:hypothetical protein